MVLLVLPPAEHLGIAKNRGIRASSQRCRSMTTVCARTPGDVGTEAELSTPGAAAQTRVASRAGIRLDPPKSTRLFKGIICDDVSEFESHMPSHAVGLYGVIFRRAHCSGSWFETRPHALFDATELVSQPLTSLRRK